MFGAWLSLLQINLYLHSTHVNQFIFVTIFYKLISLYNDQSEISFILTLIQLYIQYSYNCVKINFFLCLI